MNLKLLNNKKGIEFLPMFMFILLPFIIYLIFNVHVQVKESRFTIGEVSLGIIDTYDETAKEIRYAELSLKQSIKDNYYKYLLNGKSPDSNCGEYRGY